MTTPQEIQAILQSGRIPETINKWRLVRKDGVYQCDKCAKRTSEPLKLSKPCTHA